MTYPIVSKLATLYASNLIEDGKDIVLQLKNISEQEQAKQRKFWDLIGSLMDHMKFLGRLYFNIIKIDSIIMYHRDWESTLLVISRLLSQLKEQRPDLIGVWEKIEAYKESLEDAVRPIIDRP